MVEGPGGLRRGCPVGPTWPSSTRWPPARRPGRRDRAGRAGRVDDVLDRVGLGGVDERPVKAYSLGMRQRLGLANALLRAPRLLVLDEPTNGLDPQGIRDIRALLLELNAAGTTVFVSSHLLAEIEQMCTRVGVLDRGRMVLQDHLDDLRGPPAGCSCARPTPRAAGARRLPGVSGRRAAATTTCSSPPATPARSTPHLVGPRPRRRRAHPRAAHARGRRPGRGRPPAATGVDRAPPQECARDRRRGQQAAPQPAHLGDHPAHRRPAQPGRGAARRDRPRPAPRPGPGVPLRRAHRRHPVPARGARDRAAAVPPDRGGHHRRRGDRGRGRSRARCATCSCAPSGAPGCWWPSSSARWSSWWSRCWSWP